LPINSIPAAVELVIRRPSTWIVVELPYTPRLKLVMNPLRTRQLPAVRITPAGEAAPPPLIVNPLRSSVTPVVAIATPLSPDPAATFPAR
jgi:hypothetical protein